MLNLSKDAFCFTKQCLDVVICITCHHHEKRSQAGRTGPGHPAQGLVMCWSCYAMVATGPGPGPVGGWVTGASDSRLVPVDVCQWQSTVPGHIHNTHKVPQL